MASAKTKPRRRPHLRLVPPPLSPEQRREFEACKEFVEHATGSWLKKTHERRGNQEFMREAREHLCRVAGWILAGAGRDAALDALEFARAGIVEVAGEREGDPGGDGPKPSKPA